MGIENVYSSIKLELAKQFDKIFYENYLSNGDLGFLNVSLEMTAEEKRMLYITPYESRKNIDNADEQFINATLGIIAVFARVGKKISSTPRLSDNNITLLQKGLKKLGFKLESIQINDLTHREALNILHEYAETGTFLERAPDLTSNKKHQIELALSRLGLTKKIKEEKKEIEIGPMFKDTFL